MVSQWGEESRGRIWKEVEKWVRVLGGGEVGGVREEEEEKKGGGEFCIFGSSEEEGKGGEERGGRARGEGDEGKEGDDEEEIKGGGEHEEEEEDFKEKDEQDEDEFNPSIQTGGTDSNLTAFNSNPPFTSPIPFFPSLSPSPLTKASKRTFVGDRREKLQKQRATSTPSMVCLFFTEEMKERSWGGGGESEWGGAKGGEVGGGAKRVWIDCSWGGRGFRLRG